MNVPLDIFDAAAGLRSTCSYWYTAALIVFYGLTRSKRSAYGKVFDSTTLHPLSHAVISAIRTSGGVARTTVSDEHGRFRFLIPGGDYHIRVSRFGYAFPSRRLEKRTSIGHARDLYHGEAFSVPDSDPFFAPNIPMDPDVPGQPSIRAKFDLLWHRSENVVKLLLVGITVFSAAIRNDALLYALSVIELVSLSLWDLWRPVLRHKWGSIINSRTKRVVAYAKAELVDAKLDKIISSTITDVRGRYNFLVPKYRKMFVRVQRPGFLPYKGTPKRLFGMSPGSVQLIGFDIGLDPDPKASPAQRGEVQNMYKLSHEEIARMRESHLFVEPSAKPPSSK